MFSHPCGEDIDFIDDLWQRRRIPLRQHADAARQRLRDAVEFALDGGGQRCQPFVFHHQRADVVVGELAILGEHLLHEGFLRRLGLRPQFRFAFAESQVFGEYFALFGSFGIALDLLQTGGGGGFGEFVLILVLGFLQKTVLAAMFLHQLLQRLPDGGSIGFESLDLRLFLCKITGHQQGRGQQLRLVLAFAHVEVGFVLGLLALLLDEQLRLRRCTPAVGHDQIHIVLHELAPLIHEVLVHVVRVKQVDFSKGLQQSL